MTKKRRVPKTVEPTKQTKLQAHLESIGACPPAREWAANRTPLQAWNQSPRADWLLWWAAKTDVNSHQDIVRAACQCARLALRHVPAGELRPLQAIEAAERWADNPTGAAARAAAEAAEHSTMCKSIRKALRCPYLSGGAA